MEAGTSGAHLMVPGLQARISRTPHQAGDPDVGALHPGDPFKALRPPGSTTSKERFPAFYGVCRRSTELVSFWQARVAEFLQAPVNTQSREAVAEFEFDADLEHVRTKHDMPQQHAPKKRFAGSEIPSFRI